MNVKKPYSIRHGRRFPQGATVDPSGVNFSIFCRHATWVELNLYQSAEAAKPFQVIRLDPTHHQTYFTWHVYVEGLPSGVWYTYRVDGPTNTRETGFRHNANKELLDPWARAVSDIHWDRARASRPEERSPSMRAMVVNDDYDWEGDQPLGHPFEETILYELHLGAFTRHPSAGVQHPGTFAGMIEKIPYLKDLGITDVELMPIMAFDVQDLPASSSRLGLSNFWGYSTHSFFSPHPGYCVTPEQGTHRREFKDLVRALHRAGIGVILDVVFNHTAEGGATGPWINYKGFGNDTFYHLDPSDRRQYRDFTGCGNTVNCNHPLVNACLLDSLEYWVREFHVDGFRFDLASALARGEDGQPMTHPSFLWHIELSEQLAQTKIIAEAWDAAGLYQVGGFPGYRWREWNGRYRDVIRRFVRGEGGLIGELATRLSGNSDLYQSAGRLPSNSINFVTCHDGFTLRDLVSYDRKHNLANGEDDRDGTNENYGHNYGQEGESDDSRLIELRRRQAKNLLAILLLSQGVPMLLYGDEVLRTQRGNNNAYCQDNEIGWMDWDLLAPNADMLRFVRGLIAFRKRHPCLRHRRFLTGERGSAQRLPEIRWHGAQLNAPAWQDPQARVLAFTLGAVAKGEEDLHIVLNLSEDPVAAELPVLEGYRWAVAIDTAQSAPADVRNRSEQPPAGPAAVRVSSRSVMVLEARPGRVSPDA